MLRVFLRVKRELIQALGYVPLNTVSLERREKITNIRFKIQSKYSDSSVIEIFDPRNGKIKGHYFHERNEYHVQDVILEPKQGLIYSSEGELVEESTNWPTTYLYNSFPWNPNRHIHRLHMESAIFLPSSAFGHWLMEDLPLFISVLESNLNSAVLVSRNPPKFVSDLLQILDREIVYLDGPVRVDSLVFIQKNQDSGWPHPRDIETLNNFPPFNAVKSTGARSKNIYASRRGSKRSPMNETGIENLFKVHGFEVYQMEKLNLFDEIRLMSETLRLAGVHGSGLSNIIWMPPGGTMLDIVNNNYWTEAGHRLAFLKLSKYEFLTYQGTFQEKVDLGVLETKLKKIISRDLDFS